MKDHGQLYFNGTVRTMDPACPVAEAVAVRDGKIVAVGSKETPAQRRWEKDMSRLICRAAPCCPVSSIRTCTPSC